MPTITTTVTAACASGACTTVTTTEATPVADVKSNGDVAAMEAMINEWAAGTLIANKSKYWADSCTIDAGSTNAPGYGTYTMATFDRWIDELGEYNMNDMTWEFSIGPGGSGVLGHWTVSSLESKATGKKTTGGTLHGYNHWTMADGKATNLTMVSSGIAQIQALFDRDVNAIEAMINEWFAGTLVANKSKYWADTCTIDAGSTNAPGYGAYTMAEFDRWIDELGEYNMNDMTWEFSVGPDGSGVLGHWTVSSIESKATGKKTTGGTLHGYNHWTMADGKATNLTMVSSGIAQIQALFDRDVNTMEAMIGEWAAGTLIANKSKYWADSCTIDAGSTTAPGYGTYTMATFDRWIDELSDYIMNDMTWDFTVGPGGSGVLGHWTVSSLESKATGKKTTGGTMQGYNHWTMADGKATNLTMVSSGILQVQSVFGK